MQNVILVRLFPGAYIEAIKDQQAKKLGVHGGHLK